MFFTCAIPGFLVRERSPGAFSPIDLRQPPQYETMNDWKKIDFVVNRILLLMVKLNF
jgi:hypothetical protein